MTDMVAVLTVSFALVAQAGATQPRFDVLASDAMPGISGLTVHTIRDKWTARCYTLFVLDGEKPDVSNLTGAPPAPAMTADQLRKIRTAQALRAAAAERDGRIAELRSRMSTLWMNDYEIARQRIENEYETLVRLMLPELYPSTQVAPGLRTTSREALDDAVRRAIAEGEALTAVSTQAALDERLLGLLARLADPTRAPRFTVSGPVPCVSARK